MIETGVVKSLSGKLAEITADTVPNVNPVF